MNTLKSVLVMMLAAVTLSGCTAEWFTQIGTTSHPDIDVAVASEYNDDFKRLGVSRLYVLAGPHLALNKYYSHAIVDGENVTDFETFDVINKPDVVEVTADASGVRVHFPKAWLVNSDRASVKERALSQVGQSMRLLELKLKKEADWQRSRRTALGDREKANALRP